MEAITRRAALKVTAVVGTVALGGSAMATGQEDQKEETKTITGEEPKPQVDRAGAVMFKGHTLIRNGAAAKKNRYHSIMSNKSLDDYCTKEKNIKFSFTDDVFVDCEFKGRCEETGYRKFDIWVKQGS